MKISSRVTKKNIKKFTAAIVHIKIVSNNTLITLTDLQGNVICRSTAGECGFKGAKKTTPFAAQNIAKNISNKAKDFGIETLRIQFYGQGENKIFILQTFLNFKFLITKLTYFTQIPYKGCRPAKRKKL